MGEIVNLRRARKARLNEAEAAKAEANRVRHGRTKAEKVAGATESGRTARALDGAKLERNGEAGE